MALTLPDRNNKERRSSSTTGLTLPSRGSTPVEERRRQLSQLKRSLEPDLRGDPSVLSSPSRSLIRPRRDEEEERSLRTEFSIQPDNDLRKDFSTLVGTRKTSTPQTTDLGTFDQVRNLTTGVADMIGESRLVKRLAKDESQAAIEDITEGAFNTVNEVAERMARGEVSSENAGRIIERTQQLVDESERMIYELDDEAFHRMDRSEKNVFDRALGTTRDVAALASLGVANWMQDSALLAASSIKEAFTAASFDDWMEGKGRRIELPQSAVDAGLADQRKIDSYRSRTEDCLDNGGNFYSCPLMVGGFAALDVFIAGGVIKQGLRKAGQAVVMSLPKSQRARKAIKDWYLIPDNYSPQDVQVTREMFIEMQRGRAGRRSELPQAEGARAGARRLLEAGNVARRTKKRDETFNLTMKLLDELERTAPKADVPRYPILSKSQKAVRSFGEALIDIATRPLSSYRMNFGLSIEDVNKARNLQNASKNEQLRLVNQMSDDEIRRLALTTEGNAIFRGLEAALSEQQKNQIFQAVTFPETQVPDMSVVARADDGMQVKSANQLRVGDEVMVSGRGDETFRVAEVRENEVVDIIHTDDIEDGLSVDDPSLLGFREKVRIPRPDLGINAQRRARTEEQRPATEGERDLARRLAQVEGALQRIGANVTPEQTFTDIRSFFDEQPGGVLPNDFEITDMAITGSRARAEERTDDDLDVMLEYRGNISEKKVRSLIADADQLKLRSRFDGDVGMDITPMKAEVSGTLDDALAREETGTDFLRESELQEARGLDDDALPDLFAVHNLTPEKLQQIIDAGGAPVPSVAVLGKPAAFTSFGNVTLIGKKDLADPYNPDVKVFAGDVYTPTVPLPEFKVDTPRLNDLYGELADALKKKNIVDGRLTGLLEESEIVRNPERTIKALADNFVYRDLRKDEIKEQIKNGVHELEAPTEVARREMQRIIGEPVIKRKAVKGELQQLADEEPYIAQFVENPEIDTWHEFRLMVMNEPEFNEVLERVAETRFGGDVDRAHDWITDDLMEDFYQYDRYADAENLTKRVLQDLENGLKEVRGGQNFFVPERVYGAAQFRGVEEMKRSYGLLSDRETAVEYGTRADELVNDFLTEKLNKPLDFADTRETMLEVMRTKAFKDPERLQKIYGIEKKADAEKLAGLIRQAYVDIPVGFFEAKVLRAVGLEEFRGAIAPEHLKEQLDEIVKGTPLEGKIEYYQADDPTSIEAADLHRKERENALRRFERKNGKSSFAAMPFGIEGVLAGVQQDEDGNFIIDPLQMGLGVVAGGFAGRMRPNKKIGFKGERITPRKLFRGEKGKEISEVTKGFEKALPVAQNQRELVKAFAEQGDEEARNILQNATNFFVEADTYIAKKLAGEYDAVQYRNEHLPPAQRHTEYHDLTEGVFYDENRTMAELYAMQSRDAKWMNDRRKMPTEEDDFGQMMDDIFDNTATTPEGGNARRIGQYSQQDLEEAQLRLQFLQEAVEAHQAKPLAKFMHTRGDFKGQLPEVTGTGSSRFAREGDDIVTQHGFTDTEEARAAFEEYRQMRDELEERRSDLREIRDDIREARKNDRFVQQIRKDVEKKAAAAFKKLLDNDRLKQKLEKARERGYAKGVLSGRAEAKRQITAQLRNTFDAKIHAIRRSNELDVLRNRILQREIERKRKMIVDYATKQLPKQERGGFINRAVKAKTQRDLIKAFTRIDKRVEQIEHKKLVDEVRKQVKRINKNAGVIAVDYRKAINDLVGQFNLQSKRPDTIRKLAKLRDVVEKQRTAGQDVTIPERLLKSLEVLERKDLAQLNNSEIIEIIGQIEDLEKLGRTKLATQQRLYDIEKERKMNELVGNVVPLEKHPVIKPRPGEKISPAEKFKNTFAYFLNGAQHMDLSITPMDVFFDMMGGSTGTYEGAMSRVFKNNLDSKFQAYTRRKDEELQPIFDLMDELGLKKQNFERIGIHAARVQKDGREKLLNAGLTEKEIDDLVLSESEMRMYNAMRDKLDELREPVAQVMRQVYNEELGQVENYFSFLTDWDAMSETEVFRRVGENVEEVGAKPFTKTVEQGFTKERKGAGGQKIQIDALDVFTRHVDNVSYLIETGREIKMLGEIANSPRFGEVAGDLGQRITLEWLDLMARKGGLAGDQKIAALDMLRRNVGIAYLGFKLSSAVIQTSALGDGASLIGRWAFEGARQVSTSREIREFLVKNFDEIRIRGGDDPAFLDVSENQTMNQIQKSGYWVLKKLDLMAASSVAWGAYRKRLAEKGLEVDFANPDKDALEYAQRIVRLTQSSALFKDVPLALSRGRLTGNKSFDRALFQFQSFLLSRWARVRHDAWRAGVKQGKDFGKAGNILLWIALMTMAEIGIWRMSREAANLVTGAESQEEDVSRDAMIAVLGQIPFVSQMVSVAVFKGDPIPAFGAIRSLGTGAGQLIGGEQDATKIRGLINLSESAGAASGIPGTRQLSQILRASVRSTQESSSGLDLDLDLDIDLDSEIDTDIDIEL